ncbi:MAG: hypothetical protein ACYDAG_00985 [Chloroflexota bacterium]
MPTRGRAAIMRRSASPTLGIKAAGGIDLLAAATRLGMAAGVQVIEEIKSRRG